MPAKYLRTMYVDPAELIPYPGNPKEHDLPTIEGSLEENGQYRSVVARRLPDGDLQLLAGHGTTIAQARRAESRIRVEVIEADDATAHRIVAVDNRAPELAGYDPAGLVAFLDQFNTDGWAGTGWAASDLDDLLARAEEEAAPAFGDGTRMSPSIGEYADRYGSKATRSLMADYPNDVYVWLIDRLTELRHRYGLDSNADVLLLLIEHATEQRAPLAAIGAAPEA